jgi:propionyl-CoA carboxylase alpha chain
MFKKILIANRGEIACRVIRTAKQMGIATVAIYSEADRLALHVRMADESVCIGPAASAESYLVVDNILKAICDTGADAVHPGYGFLSENALFAEALEKKGVTFIGPKAFAINAMGDKIESKKLAMAAGVNTVPGHTEEVRDPEDAIKIANDIGYPVMLKASAGGGGKGMRVARNDDECRDGLIRATNEAKTSFGDDRVFVEKYIEEPHHIEIQVLGDSHGNVIFLGERECSIQRRHQKVIEEAPSPFIDEKTRKAMGAEAVALAKAVDYVSAGTVEFIVDKNRNFYFLEMNTRLQVEHPVTELITGLDLVELMIRVANGEKLPLKQSDVTLTGWAIEARVYAEDPFRNFLPSTGRLVKYIEPTKSETVRVDSGVYEGGEVPIYYDPMIAKLIAYGKDRELAINNLQNALDSYFIRGVNHNMSFLAALISHYRFVSGDLTTNFISDVYPDGFHAQDFAIEDPNILIAVAGVVHQTYQKRESHISGQVSGHYRDVGNEWVVVMRGHQYPITVHGDEECFEVSVYGKSFTVSSNWKFEQPLFLARFDAKDVCVQVERHGIAYRLGYRGAQVDILVLRARGVELNALMPIKELPDTSKFLLSPMPGLLISMSVEVGQEVKAGDELAVVEAMKMENVLRAEKDQIIKFVKVKEQDSLMVDQIIIEFE